MSNIDVGPNIHEDKTRFREALIFTEQQTGFSARLIEKDYYCSLVLHDLATQGQNSLVFKGGTCLCKVHVDFYRMSEDLDFLISTDIDATRSMRRKLIEPLKPHFNDLPERLPCFQVHAELKGHSKSKQYISSLSYNSATTGEAEYIKIEISLREPLLESAENESARTLLIEPFTGKAMINAVTVNALSYNESYAEKFRAALTRREPALRDIYDIDVAIRSGKLNINDNAFIELIRKKLAVPGNNSINLSGERIRILKEQLTTELMPVLRDKDFSGFDIEGTITIIAELAKKI